MEHKVLPYLYESCITCISVVQSVLRINALKECINKTIAILMQQLYIVLESHDQNFIEISLESHISIYFIPLGINLA